MISRYEKFYNLIRASQLKIFQVFGLSPPTQSFYLYQRQNPLLELGVVAKWLLLSQFVGGYCQKTLVPGETPGTRHLLILYIALQARVGQNFC